MAHFRLLALVVLQAGFARGALLRAAPEYASKVCTNILSSEVATSDTLSMSTYPPHMRGGETHYDLREELTKMKPSLAKDVIQLASPRPEEAHLLAESNSYSGAAVAGLKRGAKCTVKRFVQYAYCTELAAAWAPKNKKWTALSFGGNGYDEWSHDIMQTFNGVVPELFDCFDTRPVTGVVNHPLCIGGKNQREHFKTAAGGKHKFEDLNILLNGKADRSVLMKMDIEGSEFDVLQELEASSLRKIASLTVEYHFFGGNRCCGVDRLKNLFEALEKEFLVVDGSAQRWGTDKSCVLEGGWQWPQALSVSYVARELVEK